MRSLPPVPADKSAASVRSRRAVTAAVDELANPVCLRSAVLSASRDDCDRVVLWLAGFDVQFRFRKADILAHACSVGWHGGACFARATYLAIALLRRLSDARQNSEPPQSSIDGSPRFEAHCHGACVHAAASEARKIVMCSPGNKAVQQRYRLANGAISRAVKTTTGRPGAAATVGPPEELQGPGRRM